MRLSLFSPTKCFPFYAKISKKFYFPFIYFPISLLYGINMLSISSFISMLLLIVAGINIVKRKNRILAISCLVIVLSLLLCEGIKAFMEKEIIKTIFIGNVIINMIIPLLAFSSLFIVLKEKFVNSSRHNAITIMIYILIGIIMIDLQRSIIFSLLFTHICSIHIQKFMKVAYFSSR